MLIRDPETGRAIVEPPEVREARLAEAAVARTERAERAAAADKIRGWGGVGVAATVQPEVTGGVPTLQAPHEIVVQLPDVPATAVAAAEIALSAAHVAQPA